MDKWFGIARHVLGGIGAGIVGFGFASAEDISHAMTNFDAIIGGVMFFSAMGMSIYSKIKAAFDAK